LNSRKPLGTGCCEWLWSIAMWANGTLPVAIDHQLFTALEQWKASRHRLL